MEQVIVNGVSYLGTLEVTEAGVKVKDGIKTGGNDVTRQDVSNYAMAKNLGKLENPTFGGNGISYTSNPLDDDMIMFVKMSDLVMEQADKVAVKNLVNREYQSGLGKL